MREIFNRYLDYLRAERNASAYTIRNYETDLIGTYKRGIGRGFFQYITMREISDFRDVDKQVIRDYLSWLVERHTDKSSLIRKLSAIRSFYRFLLREEIIRQSPIPLTRSGRSRMELSPKQDQRLPVFLTRSEMEQLLNKPDLTRPAGKRDRAILELFYAAGLRVSELTGLNLNSLNLETHEVRVLGKGAKERIVLIGQPAASALMDYIAQVRPLFLRRTATDALFINRFGTRMVVRRMQKIIKQYAFAMGSGKNIHPHVLRHTFATHMLDGGADLRVVQELLGHTNLSTTQIYTHITKQQARKVYLNSHPMALEKDYIDGNQEPSPKATP
jgi:integrase/recombinase XerC